MFKEILKASRNNQASIFAFTFKFKSQIMSAGYNYKGKTQLQGVT